MKFCNTKALGMTVGMTGGPKEMGSFWYPVYWTCKLNPLYLNTKNYAEKGKVVLLHAIKTYARVYPQSFQTSAPDGHLIW